MTENINPVLPASYIAELYRAGHLKLAVGMRLFVGDQPQPTHWMPLPDPPA